MIDLHTHSTASDGSDEPAALMAMAASQGLSAVALTDHDTIEGLAEARAAATEAGLRLVQGCELSCEVGSATMHLLVYFLADGPGPLQDRLSGLQAARADRNRRIVGVLQDHGLDVTLDEILAEAGSGSVGRPHVAGVLLRKGYVSSVQEA
ncbi:MAG: PHP domain-containing protein, partial [Acidimicrobiia bacterium]